MKKQFERVEDKEDKDILLRNQGLRRIFFPSFSLFQCFRVPWMVLIVFFYSLAEWSLYETFPTNLSSAFWLEIMLFAHGT